MGDPVEEEKLREPFSHTDGESLLGRRVSDSSRGAFFPSREGRGDDAPGRDAVLASPS